MPTARIAALLAALLALCGCSTYRGTAEPIGPETLERDGWIAVSHVPVIEQIGQEDCGSAALAMVLEYWGKPSDLQAISAACGLAEGKGIRAGALRDHARSRGLKAYLVEGVIADLSREVRLGRPVIVGLLKPCADRALAHFEVVVALHFDTESIVTIDPGSGWRRNSFEGFLAEWSPAGSPALVMFPPAPNPAVPATASALGERK
jgi:ABC-type bacteriocin/lantibiotic exporter with double-glycine peptidase domain